MTDGEALPDRQRRGLRVARRQGRRALSTRTAQMFDVGVERPAPRGDGRHARSTSTATRTSPPSATTSSPRCSCSATAARPATRSTTPRRYWVPNHTPAVLVRAASTPCAASATTGPPPSARGRRGSTRSASSSPTSAVLDFETPDHRMRLRSVHPGVTVDEVQDATGFDLVVPDDVPETRSPDARRAGAHRHGDRSRRAPVHRGPARLTADPRWPHPNGRSASITQGTGPLPEGPPPHAQAPPRPRRLDRRVPAGRRGPRQRHHRWHRRRPGGPGAPERRAPVLLPSRRAVPLHRHAHPPARAPHRGPLHLRRHRQGRRHLRHPGRPGRRRRPGRAPAGQGRPRPGAAGLRLHPGALDRRSTTPPATRCPTRPHPIRTTCSTCPTTTRADRTPPSTGARCG